ncbi:hypothetical protein L6452_14873 [Arctium lappa]|uniref:Uncharacterized protein n=1 Tax=Arctium lappa TaxID=4217 RepID=A0ACB9CM89_ARCLA|nr:hypothetical protein L6452_14873 [Arctium lappa]
MDRNLVITLLLSFDSHLTGGKCFTEDNNDCACLVASIQCSKSSLRPSEFDWYASTFSSAFVDKMHVESLTYVVSKRHLKHYRDDGFDLPIDLEEKGIFNLDDIRSLTYFRKSNLPPLNSHRKTMNSDLTVFSRLVDLALVFAPSKEGNRSSKAAEFVAKNLHSNVFQMLDKCLENTTTEEVVKVAFIKTDDEFLNRYKNDPEILAMTNLIAANQRNEILEIGTISSSHEVIALWIPPL